MVKIRAYIMPKGIFFAKTQNIWQMLWKIFKRKTTKDLSMSSEIKTRRKPVKMIECSRDLIMTLDAFD